MRTSLFFHASSPLSALKAIPFIVLGALLFSSCVTPKAHKAEIEKYHDAGYRSGGEAGYSTGFQHGYAKCNEEWREIFKRKPPIKPKEPKNSDGSEPWQK